MHGYDRTYIDFMRPLDPYRFYLTSAHN